MLMNGLVSALKPGTRLIMVGDADQLPPVGAGAVLRDMLDSEYIDRRDLSWSSVQIRTMFGSGTARDSSTSGQGRVITDITVDNDAQAYRWAKGILLTHNRQSEILNIEMDFNPGYTAMVRVDVKSRTDANGRWIVDTVEQNLLDGRTKAKMLRCVDTIS